MKIVKLELERVTLKLEIKEKQHDRMRVVENNLLDKYCFVEYSEVLKRNRTKALKVR